MAEQRARIERAARRWRRLWYLGLIGLAGVVVPGLEPLRYFLLFFLIPLVTDTAHWLRRSTAARGAPALPLPGPSRRAGPLVSHARYYLSALLGLINRHQLAQMVRQVRGQHAALRRYRGDPPALDTFRQKVTYRLPFDGEWLVVNGGTTPETSHSWDLVAQRYAYDFVIADAAGHRHDADGTHHAQYHCYGMPVLAPADGVVVRVHEGVRNAPRVGTGWLDWRSSDFRGNSITIQHARGEFSFMAHLAPGSIHLRAGDRVKRGEVIGQCGNSGHSTEPHLHFQLQDHPNFFRAAGLPIAFSNCVIDGECAEGPVYLEAGMRVQHGKTP